MSASPEKVVVVDDEDRNKKLEALRDKQLAETEAVAKKQRFALFSFPPPLCIGENAENIRHLPPKDDNGKIKTLPRNVQIAHSKSGKVKSSYFNKDMSYITIGDKYIDPERLRRMQQLEAKNKFERKEQGIFKPASYYKTLVNTSYKHQSDFNEKKEFHVDAEGKVILQPKNIITGPQFKPLYKTLPHMADEYERTRTLNKEERLKHIEKLKDHAPFKNMDHGDKAFVKDSRTYGLDRPIPQPSTKREVKLNIAEHEGPFKPSNPPKKGYNKTIGPFPKYEGNPIKPLQRIDLVKTKEAFKTCHSGSLSRPTPSITSHPINIRREILSSSHLIK